jgi:hypothetical protein
VRNEAMTILKNIQKLLTLLRDGAIDKLTDVGSDTAQHASDLIELVNLQLDDCESSEGKSVLDLVKEQKTLILEVIRTIGILQSSPKDESQKDKLKSNCKKIVEGIKRLNELITLVKDNNEVSSGPSQNKTPTLPPISTPLNPCHESHTTSVTTTTTTTTTTSKCENTDNSNVNTDNHSKDFTNLTTTQSVQMKSGSTLTTTEDINSALEALNEVNESARSQNQNQLVTSARKLSTISQRLLVFAREQQKSNLVRFSNINKNKSNNNNIIIIIIILSHHHNHIHNHTHTHKNIQLRRV